MKTYIYGNSEVLAQHACPWGDGDTSADRYFYLHDRLGSVRLVIDDQGAVENTYTYEPFGQTIESGGTLDNPFRFTGQFYDEEIAEYYLRARQYDPHIARFTSRDPVIGKFKEPLTLHKYLYCGNDPVDHTDANGRVWNAVNAILTGAALYTHSIDLAAYAAAEEKWKFFDLAGVTRVFMPLGMAVATAMPTPGKYIFYGNIAGAAIEKAFHSTGMSYPEALLMDPTAFYLYAETMKLAEIDLGLTRTDMSEFGNWHGRVWGSMWK